MIEIFVYEYLTGGGIDRSLAREGGSPDLSPLTGEGRLMRDALVAELRKLDGVRVDFATSRFEAFEGTARGCQPAEGESIFVFVARMAQAHDHVWVIAPETDGLLLQLHDVVGPARWLGCTREAIRAASSKRACAQALAAHGIATTDALDPARPSASGDGPWVVKPDDGAGALDTFLFDTYAAACADYRTRVAEGATPVLQRWVDGEPLSLSLICSDDDTQLISINRQQIALIERCAPGARMRVVEFDGVRVDAMDLGSRRGQQLASLARRVGAAMPGLRGFVGIDVVWHPLRGPVVIEVNPRLTVAYAHLAAQRGGQLTQALLDAHGVRLACGASSMRGAQAQSGASP